MQMYNKYTIKITSIIIILVFFNINCNNYANENNYAQYSELDDIYYKNINKNNSKIKKLSACLKLSKLRQNKDILFYKHILTKVDLIYKNSVKNNKENPISVSDFLGLVVVTCYSSITDSQAFYILNNKDLNPFENEMKKLLNLEEYKEYYNKDKEDIIEETILNLQEKLIEVISMSKEAEIIEQKYYNILNNEIKLNFIEKVLSYLIILNSNFEFLLDLKNLIENKVNVIIILVIILLFIIFAYKKYFKTKKCIEDRNKRK